MEEKLLNNEKLYVKLPNFTGRNVKIQEIAKATGKDPNFIRVGLQQGFLKFGVAAKIGTSNEYNYFCPDKKVWEELGYFRDVTEETADTE